MPKVFRRAGGRVLHKSEYQTGKTKDVKKDKKWAALAPGKRLSKNRKKYYEYRANRSDLGFNI